MAGTQIVEEKRLYCGRVPSFEQNQSRQQITYLLYSTTVTVNFPLTEEIINLSFCEVMLTLNTVAFRRQGSMNKGTNIKPCGATPSHASRGCSMTARILD